MSQPRTSCPVCGTEVTNHNIKRHVDSHRDRRERLAVSPEEQQEMIRLHRSGKSYEAISRVTFWGTSTVRRVIVANGERTRKPGGRLPWLPVDELLRRTELYGRGYSIKEVAEICGVSYAAVRHTLIRAGTTIRPAGVNLRWSRSRDRRAA